MPLEPGDASGTADRALLLKAQAELIGLRIERGLPLGVDSLRRLAELAEDLADLVEQVQWKRRSLRAYVMSRRS